MTSKEALREIARQERRFEKIGFKNGIMLVKSAREYYAEMLEWQCKRQYAIAKFLMRNGVPKHRAWLLAGSRKGWYRMSDTPQAAEAMSNEWFVKQGLIPLVLPVG